MNIIVFNVLTMTKKCHEKKIEAYYILNKKFFTMAVSWRNFEENFFIFASFVKSLKLKKTILSFFLFCVFVFC